MQITIKIEDLVLQFLRETGSNDTKLNSYCDIKLSELGYEFALVTFILFLYWIWQIKDDSRCLISGEIESVMFL